MEDVILKLRGDALLFEQALAPRGADVSNHRADDVMNCKSLRIALQVIGSIIAVAWMWEASTRGRGFISAHLAPVAIVSLFLGGVMFLFELRQKN